MSARFERCLGFTLTWEGLFVDSPSDPGGATLRGVTQRAYDRYRDRKGFARQAVKLMTDAEMRDIYLFDYWNGEACDKLPVPVDLSVFDTAVNCGGGRSARWLQRVLFVAEDSIIGMGTLAALAARDPVEVAIGHSEIRRGYYEALDGPSLHGWLNRVDAIEKAIRADGAG